MQDACHTASNRLASIGTRISWTPVVENEHLFLNLKFLKFWHHCDPCPGPRGRATHWIKLGTTSEATKKPVYRDAPFSLLIKFSQIKNIYTSRKNILVKICLEWKTNFYCRRFGFNNLFQDSLLSQWDKYKLIYKESLVIAQGVISSPKLIK